MLEFESNPEEEFAFLLAEKLRCMVVELDDMPYEEYVKWGVYFGRKAQHQEVERKKAGG